MTRPAPLRRSRRLLAYGVLAALAMAAGTRVAAFGDDEAPRALAAQSATGLLTRPDLSPPPVTIHARAGALAPGLILLGPKRQSTTDATGPMIVDDNGQPIWFRQNPAGLRSNDVRVQTYQGRPVLTWWEGRGAGGQGRGVGVIADTSYREIARVRAKFPYAIDLHEFKLTPRGTALVIIYHTTRRDLRSVGGPRDGKIVDNVVQEIDVRTGKVLFTWHSLGSIAMRESHQELPERGSDAWDYFHANSVDEDSDGNLIVSARYSYSVTKISRRTGRILWRLGGKRSDFRMERGTRVHLAHDAEWLPDGRLRVFDNSKERVRDRSRVITLRVDTRRMRVSLATDLRHPQPVLAATQGNAESLPGGGQFVGWGSQGRWSEFGPDGDLRLDAELPDGYDSYRVYRYAWHAQPEAPPDVAARALPGGAAAVHASWNGATEVAFWRVLAGSTPGGVTPVGVAGRAGFETAITLPARPAFAAVQALDAGGGVLGTSAVVAVPAG